MRTEIKKIQALTKNESNQLRGGFVSMGNDNNGTYALWNGNCSKGGGFLWNANCGCDKCSDEEEPPQE